MIFRFQVGLTIALSLLAAAYADSTPLDENEEPRGLFRPNNRLTFLQSLRNKVNLTLNSNTNANSNASEPQAADDNSGNYVVIGQVQGSGAAENGEFQVTGNVSGGSSSNVGSTDGEFENGGSVQGSSSNTGTLGPEGALQSNQLGQTGTELAASGARPPVTPSGRPLFLINPAPFPVLPNNGQQAVSWNYHGYPASCCPFYSGWGHGNLVGSALNGGYGQFGAFGGVQGSSSNAIQPGPARPGLFSHQGFLQRPGLHGSKPHGPFLAHHPHLGFHGGIAQQQSPLGGTQQAQAPQAIGQIQQPGLLHQHHPHLAGLGAGAGSLQGQAPIGGSPLALPIHHQHLGLLGHRPTGALAAAQGNLPIGQIQQPSTFHHPHHKHLGSLSSPNILTIGTGGTQNVVASPSVQTFNHAHPLLVHLHKPKLLGGEGPLSSEYKYSNWDQTEPNDAIIVEMTT